MTQRGPPLKVIPAAEFDQSYVDSGTGAKMNLWMWKPRLAHGQFYVGDLCSSKHSPGASGFIFELGSDKSALVKPLAMNLNWNDRGTGAPHDGGFFTPSCPDGYVALGSVGERFLSDDITSPAVSNWPNLMCVKEKYTEPQTFSSITWADQGSGGHYDGTIFAGAFDIYDHMQLSGPCQGSGGHPSSASGHKLKADVFAHSLIADVLI